MEQAINLCTIIPTWGKYRYKCLQMGVRNSPENFQEKISEIFYRFEFIRACIHDLLIVTRGDWSDNLENLELTLKKLKDKRLKCNIKKSFFEHTEMEYLVF